MLGLHYLRVFQDNQLVVDVPTPDGGLDTRHDKVAATSTMLFSLRLGLTLSDGLLSTQHRRADRQRQQHWDRHDDCLWVVLLDGCLELVDFLKQLVFADRTESLSKVAELVCTRGSRHELRAFPGGSRKGNLTDARERVLECVRVKVRGCRKGIGKLSNHGSPYRSTAVPVRFEAFYHAYDAGTTMPRSRLHSPVAGRGFMPRSCHPPIRTETLSGKEIRMALLLLA